MVFADDGDRAGVVRAVAATTFAVVIRGGGIEARAGVIRIAFAFFGGFFFGSFFGFRLLLFFRQRLSASLCFFVPDLKNFRPMSSLSTVSARCLLSSNPDLMAENGTTLRRLATSVTLSL
jgi:hypothetical protein